VRLNSIKLSGFKSFAEPTHFMLPGQLVGVVGPNGCGKSNIIDAVRWVLGESRASELRGESMQDVIFSGTTTRKSSSRSSVELIFDNGDHRAGGQWSQFPEIAVKRVLTRDGTSSYYINNQPVRRRDVQDVFLGTGLGPRAYAIIGQGTISRIIESKPEELRLFLEEAAGVSKYKERRRETENRMNDTRENLTRVEDILRELNANLEKLERQAEVAQRYNDLQSQVGLKQQQFWFLKRAEALSDQTQLNEAIAQALNALEAKVADLRHLESELEIIRQAHYAAGDQVNQSQGLLYEASAEVGRLETEIRFVADGRQRTMARIEQFKAQIAQWHDQATAARQELAQLQAQSTTGDEQAEILRAQCAEQHLQLPQLEDGLRQAQTLANAQQLLVVQVQQHIQVLAADQRNLNEQQRHLQLRRERLDSDQRNLASPDPQQMLQAHAALQQAQAQAGQAQAALLHLEATLPELDAQRQTAQSKVNTESALQADLSARLQALKALQEKVKTDQKLSPWLSRHGLEGLQALWNRLHIEPGWESALEAALRERLSAIEVGQLETVQAFAKEPPPTKLSFYSPALAATPASAAAGRSRLLDLLRIHDAGQKALMSHWLAHAYTAPDLASALASRATLLPGEVIYVPQGHAITLNSVSFYAPDNEQAGLLARAQEIENLDKQVRAQSLIQEEARNSLARAQSAYNEARLQLNGARQLASESQAKAHAKQVETLQLDQLAEQAHNRSQQIDQDLAEIGASAQILHERLIQSQTRFEELDLQLADAQERYAQLEDQAMAAQRQLDEAREQLRTLERQTQEAEFNRRSLVNRRAELDRSLETADQQMQSLAEQQTLAEEELQRLSDVAAQAGLQAALALKSEREAALAAKRSEYDDLTGKLRVSDESRLQIERQLDPLRQRITELQLKEQAARLGSDQYTQMLADARADLQILAQSVAQDQVRIQGMPTEIDRIQREIQSLGAVNLAALEELSSARERKTFLDAQSADLNEAMATLEDAIKKIDTETRDLLGGTFKTVNEHFGRMFPELFGGGNARLVMTGEEILDSGVQVMAQPPGKKNQTIHLLSGGEKALTAIALVFAIFQLNPAPFCLLDEVDAPLDDANTERYSKLVSTMAKETQFLFISHNKIAMQMAEQLIGVTMQERGVSRIVAVDMESAVGMVESV